MNPANRQPSSKLGDLWIVARKNSKLQLASGLDCKTGKCRSESRSFRLAAAVDAEQDYWRRIGRCRRGLLCFRCRHSASWNQKGTRNGSLGFTGYGLLGSGFAEPTST
jgi:hypothetical protein